MLTIRLDNYNIRDSILKSITNQEERLFFWMAEETSIFVGKNTITNSCDLPIIELPNAGGVIISGKGSMATGYISHDLYNHFNEDFAAALKDWLLQKELTVTQMGNDILINGYKVASSSTARVNNMLFSAFHISFSVDLDLINTICTKRMEKVPKGLEEFGISQCELQDFFLNFINNYSTT